MRWFNAPPCVARGKYEARAARDLDTLLAQASRALRPGGTLVAVTPARVMAAGGAIVASEWWHEELAAFFMLTAAAGIHLVEFPTCYTLDMWESALVRASHVLQPASARVVAIDDLYARDARDADEYAREHTASVVAVFRRIINALPRDVAARLVDAFEAAARARFAANVAARARRPAGHSVILHAVRRSSGAA